MKPSVIMRVLLGTALATAIFFKFVNVPTTIGELPTQQDKEPERDPASE